MGKAYDNRGNLYSKQTTQDGFSDNTTIPTDFFGLLKDHAASTVINNKYSGESRADDRITRFIAFSHGFADGTLALGYNYSSNYNKSLNISISDVNTRNIKTFDAFDNPNSAFYSCNTGTGAGGSFAQAWVNITGGTTWAFAGRTNYGNMNKGEGLGNKMSRRRHGFSYYGSHNYPEADEGAYLVTFRKWWP